MNYIIKRSIKYTSNIISLTTFHGIKQLQISFKLLQLTIAIKNP